MQINFANGLKNFEKGTKAIEKKYLLNNLGLLFNAREKVLHKYKIRLFSIKKLDKIPTTEPTTKSEVTKELATEPEVATEPTKATKAKTKRKISLLKFHEKFLNEIGN